MEAPAFKPEYSLLCREWCAITLAQCWRVYNTCMKDHVYTAVIERDTATGFYVAYVPDLPGAHTQAETLEELQDNLKEVVELVLEDSELPKPESKFVGTQLVVAG
jgi:predicted RNase H-like HicB family nuclease